MNEPRFVKLVIDWGNLDPLCKLRDIQLRIARPFGEGYEALMVHADENN